ncbi:MAG: hypothetical protein ACE5EX_09855 [Phycisphaerae bacterium]
MKIISQAGGCHLSPREGARGGMMTDMDGFWVAEWFDKKIQWPCTFGPTTRERATALAAQHGGTVRRVKPEADKDKTRMQMMTDEQRQQVDAIGEWVRVKSCPPEVRKNVEILLAIIREQERVIEGHGEFVCRRCSLREQPQSQTPEF